MKLTCTYVKRKLPTLFHSCIYKSGGDVMLNLYPFKEEMQELAKKVLSMEGIECFQRDPVHLSGYYTLAWRREDAGNLGR